MWPVVIFQIFRKVRFIDRDDDRKFVANTLAKLANDGILDNPPTGLESHYRGKIMRFIRLYSSSATAV